MTDETVSDALLREFLLGKLSDEEHERIESLFLDDSQIRERVLAVEQDLIEEYLEESLTAADRERFVARYAQTAEQRRKLRITRSIKEWAVSQASLTPSIPPPSPGWTRLRAWLKPVFVVPIAVATMVAIIVAGVWLNSRSKRLGIEQELAQLNAPERAREVPSASLELRPVTVRGIEPAGQLNVPTQSGAIELRLVWIQKERYSRYHGAFRHLGDNEVFAISDLRPEADGNVIRLKLPARILTRGTYQVEISGIAADGSSGATEEYNFAVTE